MPRIQANRDAVDDRFSVLGFTVRSESPLFEVGVATDPQLFRADRKADRSRRNFFSSRAAGVLRARRGEAVYLLPPDVLSNFVGQPKLYFGLATYRDNSKGTPDFVQAPGAGNMYVNLAGLTERGLRRLVTNTRTSSYGQTNGRDPSLEWGGDAWPQAADAAGATAPVAATNGNGAASTTAPAMSATAPAYDDGFGAFPAEPQAGTSGPAATANPANPSNPAPSPASSSSSNPATQPAAVAQALRHGAARAPAYARPAGYARPFDAGPAAVIDEDDARGIEGPIPDTAADPAVTTPPAIAKGLEEPAPEYPQASRFVSAARENYRAMASARTIDRVVIHITDGGANVEGTIAWFRNPQAQVSAHYVIGQDGEVVQMVRNNDKAWHARSANATSIGIEHVANTRGLMPTGAQLCASAALVTWLCDQYGITPDRSRILGHAEADPRTTHTGCPNAVWDWDHYMRMIETRSCIEPAAAVAQSLGMRRRALERIPAPARATAYVAPRVQARSQPPAHPSARAKAIARAQEIIFPFYDPADPASALTCQNDAFSLAREEWFVGVPNTQIFPHSAICQLVMSAADGSTSVGSGFYIGPNRVLTCAHNLSGKSSVTIIPARNGSGEKPFGEVGVPSSSWRVAPRYSGSGDWGNDLAVIDNVPLAAPNGQWFGFLNATPSDQMPLVVCGYSRKSVTVPELTALMDGDKQHLHGGYASSQSDPETIDYAILTLKRASGSPVYHLSSASGQLEALVTAVHVSGEPAAQGLNRGCFLTPQKLDWIEGRTTSFALARRPEPRAMALARPRALGLTDLLPVDLKLRVFIPAPAVFGERPVLSNLALGGDGRGFQFDGGTSRCEITARFHFGGGDQRPRLSDITRSFGESTNYSLDDLVAVPGKPDWWRELRPGAQATERGRQTVTDGRLSVALGGTSNDGMVSMLENATVVTFEVHASDPLVTVAADIDARLAVMLKVEGERIQARLRGGHDEFPAYELYANGVLVYSYDPVAAGGTPMGLLGVGVVDVNPETTYVDAGPATEYRLIGPVRINGASAQALGYAYRTARPRALGASISIHWDDVPSYPQSSTTSCWAASAAMVVGWRDRMSIPDTEIARMVPVIDAYRTGLWPNDRRALADAWGLVAEPPASYTIEAWAQMLEAYGPLYIDMTWSGANGGHVRVLVGMESDGNPDGSGTTMYMHDPWPDTPGRIKLPFADFLALYENRTGNSGGQLLYQILHADHIPDGVAPVTAAPFALTHAPLAEPQAPTKPIAPLAPKLDARGLPVPPAPIVQQQGLRTRAMSDEMVEHPSPIPGTRLTRTRGSDGSVTWDLDQLDGVKQPEGAAPAVVAPLLDGPVLVYDQWPYVEGDGGQRTRLDLELRWQYDGSAVGNVRVTRIASASGAAGHRLDVTARVADVAGRFPSDNPSCAAIDINIDYRFTRPDASVVTAVYAIRLFGNGKHNGAGRWLEA